MDANNSFLVSLAGPKTPEVWARCMNIEEGYPSVYYIVIGCLCELELLNGRSLRPGYMLEGNVSMCRCMDF